MQKSLLGAAAAIAIAAVGFSGSANAGLLLEGLQLELCVAAGLLSTLHLSVRLPAVLYGYPSPTTTGHIRTGIHRVIPVRQPAPTAVINPP